MEKKRTIAIGDVHGCLAEVKQLLDRINYDTAGDRLIFLGDLVDRGPNSAECVKFVRGLNVECVVGNHDNKLIRFHGHELNNKKTGKKNPIKYSEDQIAQYSFMDVEDVEWLGSLPTHIFCPDLNTVFLHAGVMMNHHPLHQPSKAYMFCRYIYENGQMARLGPDFQKPADSIFWTEAYKHNINIVYGHQVFERPRIRTNALGAKTFGIDTGACYGGKLTALVFNENNIQEYNVVQVRSSYKYKDFFIGDKNL